MSTDPAEWPPMTRLRLDAAGHLFIRCMIAAPVQSGTNTILYTTNLHTNLRHKSYASLTLQTKIQTTAHVFCFTAKSISNRFPQKFNSSLHHAETYSINSHKIDRTVFFNLYLFLIFSRTDLSADSNF